VGSDEGSEEQGCLDRKACYSTARATVNVRNPLEMKFARLAASATPLFLLASGISVARAADSPLVVRVSPAAAPCTRAAARAWEASRGAPVTLTIGALPGTEPADAFVGASVELTRVLEGGAGSLDSEVSVATIPWVLAVAAGSSTGVRSLSDLGRAEEPVALLGGPAAYEARRALAEKGGARVRETTEADELRTAPVAIVPLSLAGPGERHALDIRPIRVVAAVAEQSGRPEAARAFVRFLGTETGQKAFSTCGQTAPAR
jgi:Bacterial extracellular solute-binding protein